MPSPPPTRVPWLSQQRIASQGTSCLCEWLGTHEAFRLPNKRVCIIIIIAPWTRPRHLTETSELQHAEPGQWELNPSSSSLFFAEIFPPWSLRSAHAPITADSGLSGFRTCGQSQNGIRQFLHAGHQTRIQPTRKVGIETGPLAAIVCHLVKPRSVESCSVGVELMCLQFHTTLPNHLQTLTTRVGPPAIAKILQVSAGTPIPPMYACTLRVSSHLLRRFRRHLAASSSTHPSWSSPIGTTAQEPPNPSEHSANTSRSWRAPEWKSRLPPLQQFAALRLEGSRPGTPAKECSAGKTARSEDSPHYWSQSWGVRLYAPLVWNHCWVGRVWLLARPPSR